MLKYKKGKRTAFALASPLLPKGEGETLRANERRCESNGYGAISLTKVLAVMTMNGSMDGNAFEVFIQRCLLPQLWVGAIAVLAIS